MKVKTQLVVITNQSTWLNIKKIIVRVALKFEQDSHSRQPRSRQINNFTGFITNYAWNLSRSGTTGGKTMKGTAVLVRRFDSKDEHVSKMKIAFPSGKKESVIGFQV